MNATFETIRQDLKKYNAEDNDVPPKIVVAGNDLFLDIEHKRKRNSQFIIGVREFPASEKFLIERMLDELEIRMATKPLVFLYDDREAIENAIKDFEDYYNRPLGKELFQKIGRPGGQDKVQFCLIIVVVESYFYES